MLQYHWLSPVIHSTKLHATLRFYFYSPIQFSSQSSSCFCVCFLPTWWPNSTSHTQVNVAWLWFLSATSQREGFTLRIKADIQILGGHFKVKRILYLYQNTAPWKSQVAWNRMVVERSGCRIMAFRVLSIILTLENVGFLLPSKITSRNLSRSWWRIWFQHPIGKLLNHRPDHSGGDRPPVLVPAVLAKASLRPRILVSYAPVHWLSLLTLRGYKSKNPWGGRNPGVTTQRI